jgi:2-polyprenyl-3-methyl-5-hydroxy-6-metoxy-1,4-benzoquinol methylase
MISKEMATWSTQPSRLLDIAAGHRLFGISAAQAIPSLEVTAIDWPTVLTVAHENASAAGVAQRYRTIGGSAFDVDWGEGYDVVLLTNFLHHFDRDTCIDLLARARRLLRSGGASLLWSSFRTTTELHRPFRRCSPI